MSVMIADPLPSTFIDSSSMVGVRPVILISLAPGFQIVSRGLW